MNKNHSTMATIEGETWRIVNDIIKPKNTVPITIRTKDGDVTDEAKVADLLSQKYVLNYNSITLKRINDSFIHGKC